MSKLLCVRYAGEPARKSETNIYHCCCCESHSPHLHFPCRWVCDLGHVPSPRAQQPFYVMRELDADSGRRADSCSQKPAGLLTGQGWDREGGQLVSCGQGGDLGSKHFLFPRGNPGSPCPKAAFPASTSSPAPATMALCLQLCPASRSLTPIFQMKNCGTGAEVTGPRSWGC